MTTRETNELRTKVREKMAESAVRAEHTEFWVMRQIYAGQSQAYEEVLRLLGDYEEEE